MCVTCRPFLPYKSWAQWSTSLSASHPGTRTHTHTHCLSEDRSCLPMSFEWVPVIIKSIPVFSSNLPQRCFHLLWPGLQGSVRREIACLTAGAPLACRWCWFHHWLGATAPSAVHPLYPTQSRRKGVVLWWFKFRFRRLTGSWDGKTDFSHILKTWGSY